ncbi:MAG: hypothetical protein MRY76_07030 [Pseudomonadales bacterium]|nr:hypothetical protein [Pseudomonadales bacterium]
MRNSATRFHPALLASLLLLSMASRAEVTAVSEAGFVSEHTITLATDPDRAFQALTADIQLWWDASHSYSLEAANFRLEAVAGGCFCETLPDGGEVEHMRVVFVAPGKTLRLSGGLGPLQQIASSGAMTFDLKPNADGSTRLDYRYVVSGYQPGGLQAWAEPVDQVQWGQLLRLQAYLQADSSP